MITVKNVSKRFKLSKQQRREMGDPSSKYVNAVDDVSFSCQPGRIFSLLGPNGAGKTTVLRLISTTLRPSSGDITVAGKSVTREPQAVRRRLGFLTGSTKLYDRLNPKEIVKYYADLHGMSSAQFKERKDRIFEQLEINDYAGRRIGKLSTGMQQKVSIARTIIHDPEVLVFDEATAGLDVLASRNIVDLIRGARDEGKTVLFSTHRMGEASQLSDDMAIIHRGKILYNGTYEAFKQQMQSRSLEDEFIRLIEGTRV